MASRTGAAGRGRRGGGGAARRAERTATKVQAEKFIERKIPCLDLLNDEALEIIEANAELMLAEIGVDFVDNPSALALWEGSRRGYSGPAGAHPARLGSTIVRHRTRELHATCA